MQQLFSQSTQIEDDQAAIEAWLSSIDAPLCSRIMAVPRSRDHKNRDANSARAKRKAEFAAGRRCAESLLKRLGNTEQVWVNEDRSPAWPVGFVGSISHSQYWTWAAVARDRHLVSAGIDTEPIVQESTREQIAFEIATPDEWDACQRFDMTPDEIFSVIFSAKEAFYKCCYPVVQHYFGFEHAIVETFESGRVTIRTHESHPCIEQMPTSLDVHYQLTDRNVFAITWMEQSQ